MLLWAGLTLLVLQWGVFLRLTFFELSWDVMEPISYFFSSLWGIVAYAYFMASRLAHTLLWTAACALSARQHALSFAWVSCRSPKRTLRFAMDTAK